jgi:nucleotide exchange factor SIL1
MQFFPSKSISLLLLLLCVTVVVQNHVSFAKEIEVTKEWTKLEENDTLPEGVHVRMDMTTGEKWAKLLDVDEEEDQSRGTQSSNSNAATSTSMAAVIVQDDGSTVQMEEYENEDEKDEGYDIAMMHRTLSKLPDEEKERMGGLPALPAGGGMASLTPRERELFEMRMKQIWEKRQQELLELQESLMDLPEVLKQRIASIREYLEDPTAHLKQHDLDELAPKGRVTHIVSVLQDLEYQLTDLDMARDFHTLSGWPLLVSLLAEEVHISQTQNATLPNKKIPKMEAKRIQSKIRVVQTNAAWVIGTAVKNTGEFFPYAIEEVRIQGDRKTTAIDLLIQVFVQQYDDPASWEVRKLQEKAIYAIGSLLRGNRMAQIHVCSAEGPNQLGKMLNRLSSERLTSTNLKLTQRLISLASDIVLDIDTQGDLAMEQLNGVIVKSFTNPGWCDATIKFMVIDTHLPIQVQEKILKSARILAPYCAWKDKAKEAHAAISRRRNEWTSNKDDFDDEHLKQLIDIAQKAADAFENAGERR